MYCSATTYSKDATAKMSASGTAMDSVFMWSQLIQIRNFWQFGSAAIRCMPYTVRSAFLAIASLHVAIVNVKWYSSLWQVSSELRGITCHMGSHSVTCHPTQVNSPHLTPARQAGTRFAYPVVMEDWADIHVGDLLHTEMVHPLADGHPSKY